MAKRIKIKGKPPRGLSKAQRIKIAPLQRKRNKIVSSERKRADPFDTSESTLDAIDRYDYMIDEIAERPDISSRPSSTRKKRGNPKFSKKRSLASEIAEDKAARRLERFGGTRPRRDGETRKNYRARDDVFGRSREHAFGHGGISRNPRLKELFERLSDRYWGP